MPETLEAYLERVYSYDLKRFFIFSKKLNPYKCATFGYHVTDLNELSCQQCGVVISLNNDDFQEYSKTKIQEKVDFYLNLMKKSHHEDCYFYNLKEFEYFKISREIFDIEWENFYSENLLSYQNVNQESVKLPILDKAVENLIPQNYWKIFMEDPTKSMIFDTTKILSVFGWRYLEENSDGSYLFCRFCGRKIKISLFMTKPSSSGQTFQENNNEGNFMNPLDEHRFFCKWGKKDIKGVKIYGWNICLNYLFQKYTEDPKYKGILDKTSQITKIKYEILKGVEELKNFKGSMIEKYKELEEKVNHNNNFIENYKEKLKERRQTFEEIFEDCGQKLELIIKKYKI